MGIAEDPRRTSRPQEIFQTSAYPGDLGQCAQTSGGLTREGKCCFSTGPIRQPHSPGLAEAAVCVFLAQIHRLLVRIASQEGWGCACNSRVNTEQY